MENERWKMEKGSGGNGRGECRIQKKEEGGIREMKGLRGLKKSIPRGFRGRWQRYFRL
jgi:hypothetical protein